MDRTARLALARYVRLLREHRGLTQRALQIKTGVSQGSISHIEDARLDAPSPRLETIEALADFFGLPAWRLLVPGQDPETLLSHSADKVLENYVQASPEGRDYIGRVAEREASYRIHTPDEDGPKASNS